MSTAPFNAWCITCGERGESPYKWFHDSRVTLDELAQDSLEHGDIEGFETTLAAIDLGQMEEHVLLHAGEHRPAYAILTLGWHLAGAIEFVTDGIDWDRASPEAFDMARHVARRCDEWLGTTLKDMAWLMHAFPKKAALAFDDLTAHHDVFFGDADSSCSLEGCPLHTPMTEEAF